jgi:hypothetical protein
MTRPSTPGELVALPEHWCDAAAHVACVAGTIWTIGGDRQWDALPADPSELANELVEIPPVGARQPSKPWRT